MDASTAQGLYPLHHCKILHLVRHAQGFHNAAEAIDPSAEVSYDYFDAALTPLGWKQVDKLREHVQATGISNKIELVIISPLTRTMQTAVGIFGGGSDGDVVGSTPLMVADAGNSGRPAVSSIGCPPFLSFELCREKTGIKPCDKWRSKTEYETLFPAIDFSLIESNEDIWWKEESRETDEEVAKRGSKFMRWLWTRREKEIAIVSHSGFLLHTLSAFGNDCHPILKKEICSGFGNCELRSMVFVNKCLETCESPTTNFPGNIPDGADVPSDVSVKKIAPKTS